MNTHVRCLNKVLDNGIWQSIKNPSWVHRTQDSFNNNLSINIAYHFNMMKKKYTFILMLKKHLTKVNN